jgi:hypothetical protein
MSRAELVVLALKASILAIVFALGLTANPGDLTISRRPWRGSSAGAAA